MFSCFWTWWKAQQLPSECWIPEASGLPSSGKPCLCTCVKVQFPSCAPFTGLIGSCKLLPWEGYMRNLCSIGDCDLRVMLSHFFFIRTSFLMSTLWCLWTRVYGRLVFGECFSLCQCGFMSASPQSFCEVAGTMLPNVQMRKLKLRKVRPVSKWTKFVRGTLWPGSVELHSALLCPFLNVHQILRS